MQCQIEISEKAVEYLPIPPISAFTEKQRFYGKGIFNAA